MTNDEAKQQAIINAYGEYWDKLKEYVDENGWVTWKVVSHGVTNNLHPEEDFNLPFGFYQTKNDYGCGKFEWRPKSLQGIENNNFWIKIESENDLPKDDIYCHFIVGKLCYNGWWDNDLKAFYNNFNEIIGVTHYRPIEIPKPPIY